MPTHKPAADCTHIDIIIYGFLCTAASGCIGIIHYIYIDNTLILTIYTMQ